MMDITGKLNDGADWVANNPKSFAAGALIKGSIVGTGIAAYQVASTPTPTSSSSDNVSQPQSKTAEFGKDVAEDIGITVGGAGAIYGLSKGWQKYRGPREDKVADTADKPKLTPRGIDAAAV